MKIFLRSLISRCPTIAFTVLVFFPTMSLSSTAPHVPWVSESHPFVDSSPQWLQIKKKVHETLPDSVKKGWWRLKRFVPLKKKPLHGSYYNHFPYGRFNKDNYNHAVMNSGSPLYNDGTGYIITGPKPFSEDGLQQIITGLLQAYFRSWRPSTKDLAKTTAYRSLRLLAKRDHYNHYSKLTLSEPRNGVDLDLAKNAERFLRDPLFSCRKPYTYKLFKRTFPDWKPASKQDCADLNTTIFSHSGKPVHIDFNRVYEIHYLLASEGSGIGAFGHTMIRVVMCREGQKKDKTCLSRDINHDIIFNFRAFVNGVALDPIIGLGFRFLTSKTYPSQLMVYNMFDVVQEYTDEERNLHSYPIYMTEEQKVDFLKLALETYWGYQGKYAFISRNCATETANMLNIIFPYQRFSQLQPPQSKGHGMGAGGHRGRPKAPPSLEDHSVTPIGSQDDLAQLGLIDTNLGDTGEKGVYIFNRYTDDVAVCLQRLHDAQVTPTQEKPLSQKEFEELAFLGMEAGEKKEASKITHSSALSRRALFKQKFPHNSLRTMACFPFLEEVFQPLSYQYYEGKRIELIKALPQTAEEMEALLKSIKISEDMSLAVWIEKYIQEKERIFIASQFIKKDYEKDNYGVPLKKDFDMEKFKQTRASLGDLFKVMARFLEKQRQDIEEHGQFTKAQMELPEPVRDIIAEYVEFRRITENQNYFLKKLKEAQ